MAFSRRLGVIWIAGASWLVAVGCDDSEDQVTQPARAGEGGEAPSAGKSSVAGSQNNGGKAGASAGSAGSAGKTTGGTNGSGGDAGGGGGGEGGRETSAGQAGVGGDMAGAGGVGGEATGGVGGAAGGQGGAGGEGGVLTTVAPHCSFSCDSDDDCLIEDDDSVKCNLTTGTCEDPTNSCTVDAECLSFLSFWNKPCTSDANCTANTEACITANDTGFCAKLPVAAACTNSLVPKTLPRLGAQGTIAVCAHADARCFNRVCRPGCATPNFGCGKGNGDTCSAATGLCGCTSDTECTATSKCGSDGRCKQCENNDDCAGNPADPVCIGGKCGCESATACADFDPGYASATAVCQ